MLKCGDVIKCSRVRRMNIAIDEVLVILGIAPTKNGIYIAYKNKEDKDKEDKESYMSSVVNAVCYICMHITYTDENMPNEVNMDYIRTCIDYCMQNNMIETKELVANDSELLYHIEGMEAYITKNRLLNNFDISLLTEEDYLKVAREFYENVNIIYNEDQYIKHVSSVAVKDFKLGRVYVERNLRQASFFVPVATQGNKIVTVNIATYMKIWLNLQSHPIKIKDELLDYCIDIDKNGHLTDYNIEIAIRKVEDMQDSVIIQTPLVLHSDNFIEGDLKEDVDFKRYIKEHMEVEPENLFAY